MISSYNDAKRTCSNFGGELSMDVSQEFLPKYTFGDPAICSGRTKFWLPIVLDGYFPSEEWGRKKKYRWLSDQQNGKEISLSEQKWARSQPNGYGSQNCVGAMETSQDEYFWNDVGCSTKLCSVCTIPVVQTYYLRGPGPNKHISDHIDRKYSLLMELQDDDQNVVFEGQGGKSQITVYSENEAIKTILKRYDNKSIKGVGTTIEYHGNPFGIISEMQWKFTRVS